MIKKNRLKLIFLVFFILLIYSQKVSAFEITAYDNMPVEGDLILGPGKTELTINPGEIQTKEVKVTNRTGGALEINVGVEDFTGDNISATKLLGGEKGPYSLRDYLIPDKDKFILHHGEKATIVVEVRLPKDAEPGGLYGAIIISSNKVSEDNQKVEEGAKGAISVTSRLGSLFFVKVNGEAKEEGRLKSFNTNKTFYQAGDVNFNIQYENTGRVHLNPYARIEITNLMGKKIDSIDVAPWFVMPGFSRDRSVPWGKLLALGRYKATLELNRGYGENNIDVASTTFYVIPLKILIISISIILFLAIIIVWFSSKFELKKK
jgi:hypothetical protein